MEKINDYNQNAYRDTVDRITEIAFNLEAARTVLSEANDRICSNSSCSKVFDNYTREEFLTLHKIIYIAEDKIYDKIKELEKLAEELEN